MADIISVNRKILEEVQLRVGGLEFEEQAADKYKSPKPGGTDTDHRDKGSVNLSGSDKRDVQ